MPRVTLMLFAMLAARRAVDGRHFHATLLPPCH